MSETRRRRSAAPGIAPDYQEQQHEAPYETPQQQATPPHAEQPQTIIVNQIAPTQTDSLDGASYFDGGLLSLIGWSILAGLITLFTLGLGYPFAACMLYKWEARHTIINGRRLCFDGNGWQLIGKWIVWMLLTLITLGIYSFWLVIKLKQWRIKHTHFA